MLIVRTKKKLFQIKNTSIYRRAYLERNIELKHENLPFLDDEKIRIFKNTQHKKQFLFASFFLFNHSSLRFTRYMPTLIAE